VRKPTSELQDITSVTAHTVFLPPDTSERATARQAGT